MDLNLAARSLALAASFLSAPLSVSQAQHSPSVQERAQLIALSLVARLDVGSRTDTRALDACSVRIALGLPLEARVADAFPDSISPLLINTDSRSCERVARDYGTVEVGEFAMAEGAQSNARTANIQLRVWRTPFAYEEESFELREMSDTRWTVVTSSTRCCRPNGADIFVRTPKPGLIVHYVRRDPMSLLVVDRLAIPPWSRDSVLRSLAGSTLDSISFVLPSKELQGRFGSAAAFGAIFVTRKQSTPTP